MSTLQRGYVAAALLAVGVYTWLPAGAAASWLYPIISLTAPLAIVVGIARFKPVKRTPWVLFAVGFALYLVGDIVFAWYDLRSTQVVPFPNVGDLAYLAFYPVVFVALAMVVRSGAARNRAAWLDASIWTVGAAILLWEPLLEPYVTDSTATALDGIIAVAYPLMDIALLLMLVRLFIGGNARTPTFWLIMVSFSCQTLSDVAYGIDVFGSYPVVSRLMDAGWLLTYVAIGAAALHPSMVAMTEQNTEPAALTSRRRLMCLIIPTLLAPGLLIFQLITGSLGTEIADGVVLAAASTSLVLLVLARGAGLLVIAERRSDQLVDRQAQLELALVQLNVALADRERSNVELNDRVTKDFLTGLANRAYFVACLEESLAVADQTSVAFLDLDDFKSINDTLGHEAGDVMLVELAARLTGLAGPHDLVARFGGDEFAVLVHGDVEALAERVLAALKAPILLHGRDLRVQVSIGVTTTGTAGGAGAGVTTGTGAGAASASDLLRRADIAMYTAKRAGGGWARYQTGMSSLLRRRMDLRARLETGLRDGEVTPWFQPIVDLRTGALRGFEALARWTADGTTLLPADWLGMAEETGLVITVDHTICRAAFAQLATWRTQHRGAADLHLAVNLSARTLHQPGIATDILDLLTEVGLPANRIVIEVNEGMLIDDADVSAQLQTLRTAGIRIALDDFGTGWSSLSYLQRFPVDLLKLDRTFTAELGTHPGADAIPAAVLQLARALSLGVIAEGVETTTQATTLINLGFTQAQGYLYAHAQPAHQLNTLLNPHPRPTTHTTTADHDPESLLDTPLPPLPVPIGR